MAIAFVYSVAKANQYPEKGEPTRTNDDENVTDVVCAFVFKDELARVLVTLFDSRHLLYQLLWNMFSKEVELADSMQTLFRGNSLASKIMTFCFKVGLSGITSA